MKLSSPRLFSNSGLQSKDQQTHKKTTFIYNGQNGLSLRPVSVPEVADLPVYSIDMLFHIFDYFLLTIFFALSYIYLLLISSYHYFSGHLETRSTHWLAQATFADFLHGTYIPPTFAEDILIPLFACVATCSPEELLDYPAAEFLEYIVKTFGQVHYTVRDGVKTVVDGLLVDISRRDQVHLDCELVSMRRSLLHPGKLELEDSAGQILLFDHIIFATQANQAVSLMQTYHKSLSDEPVREDALLAQERKRIDALKQFRYTHSAVVNHYDSDCTLGISAANKRMLNIATWQDLPPQSGQKADTSKQVSGNYTMATHNLSIAHPRLTTLKGKPLLQTTNPTVDIAEEYIVSKKRFERAIVTRQSKRALEGFLHPGEKGSMQGGQGIWFVGAWAAEVRLCSLQVLYLTFVLNSYLSRAFRC
jgi:predicted NAD/FAD-binding protein